MHTRYDRFVRVFRALSPLLLLLVPAVSISLTHGGYENGRSSYLSERFANCTMGGLQSHLAEDAPRLEMRFCLTQRRNALAEWTDCTPTWSVPYFSLSVPVGSASVGFCRSSLEDYNCGGSSSSGVLLSCGELWSNCLWWKQKPRPWIGFKLEVGFLNGETVRVRGTYPYLFLSRRQAGGQVVGGSISLLRKDRETCGGVRHYFGSERPDEFWLGVRKGDGRRQEGMIEVIYRPRPGKIVEMTEPLEFRFAARKAISTILWFNYGLAALPSSFLVSFILGCGFCREMIAIDAAICSSLSERQSVMQLSMGVSSKL